MSLEHSIEGNWIKPCLEAIEGHNNSHSQAAHFGRSFAGFFGALLAEETECNTSGSPVISTIESPFGLSGFDSQAGEVKEVDLIHMRNKYGNQLNKIGLKLVSDAEFLSEIGGNPQTDHVFIFVGDENRFKKFIDTLNRNNIDKNPELSDLVNGVIRDSIRLLHSPQSSGEHRAVIEPVRPLFEKLDNFNMASLKAEFAPLIEASDGNYLSQYLDAMKQQLVQEETKGFTPEKWIADPAPTDFPRRWDNAVKLVEELSDNFAATKFCNQLVKRLLDAARASLAIHKEAKEALENGNKIEQQETYARDFIGKTLDRALYKLEPLESPF